jgi:tetratricopeptide (TPR) repeat protein
MNRLLAAVCTALFLLLGTTLPLYAQSPPDTLSATANTAYQAKDWATAQPLYLRLTQSQPDNGRMWYRLGVCYQSLGKHKEALDAFQKAQATGVPLGIVGYNLAAAFATLGQTDKAFDQLSVAIKQGYNQPEQMSSDPDFQSLHADSRFATLVEQAKHNQAPCDYTAENRQFDFWVGDWDVVSTQASTPAGLSHIERTIGNCVIWENWTSIGNPGYTGKSYNIYNANFKRWEQFWVDSQGGMIHFYGNLDHSIMDFYTDEIPQPDGTKLKRHLQFFNLGPDKVRQFSQGSTDGGQTWSVEYDLTYNRKK